MPPHQPPVILSDTLELGWAPLTCDNDDNDNEFWISTPSDETYQYEHNLLVLY